jgi:hypothetical protein
MDSAHTLRDFTLSISPQWDVSAFTEEQNKETRRYYSTYRTDEKEKKGKKIPSIKRIKSWIPLINEECDYKGDGNFWID